MGANPHVNGGRIRVPLELPELDAHAAEITAPGSINDSALETLGNYLADVFRLNDRQRNFRIVCPDEVASNRLQAVFKATGHAYEWPVDSNISPDYLPDGRVMEVLSEHNCQGWLQGYVLTGRHGIFPCYEAFIPIVDGMVNQYGKFLKMSREEAQVARPGLVAELPPDVGRAGARTTTATRTRCPASSTRCSTAGRTRPRVYLPPDSNTLLATMAQCLKSTGLINLVIANKHPMPAWLSLEEAIEHVRVGASRWEWASNDDGAPDVVLAGCGSIPTIELLAATSLLREEVPDLRIRFVNVTNLFTLASAGSPSRWHDG